MAEAQETPPREEVTRLLVEWGSGSKQALDLLTPIVYRELHLLADRYLRRERDAATLQPTALVHEAYLRLVAQNLPDWQSRSHFFGVAAQLMRQILVDHARKHRSVKRGAGGLSVEETAQVLNISVATVGREQRLGQAWLHNQLSAGHSQ